MASYALLADVKLILKIATSDTTYDALIARRIASASAMIDSLCGRSFARTTYSQYVACNGQHSIWAQVTPVITSESMTLKDRDAAVVATLAAADVDATTGEITLDSPLPDYRELLGAIVPVPMGTGPTLLTLNYTGGYVLPGDTPIVGAPDLPDDLRALCEDLACAGYSAAGRDGAVSGETLGSYSWYRPAINPSSLSPSQLVTIERYKRWL